jgi:hypothetical protein
MEVLVATARSAKVNGEYDTAARAYLEAIMLGGGLDLACEASEVLVVLGRMTEGRALAEVVLAESEDPSLIARAESVVETSTSAIAAWVADDQDRAAIPRDEAASAFPITMQREAPRIRQAAEPEPRRSEARPRRRRLCGQGRCLARLVRMVANVLAR